MFYLGVASFLCMASTFAAALTFPQIDLDYTLCQYPTLIPLLGCPWGTIIVGPQNRFRSVQAAIDSLPNDNSIQHILVLAGNYTEQLNVTRRGPIRLLGQTKGAKSQAGNSVNLLYSPINVTNPRTGDNAYTSVLTVAPNLNASLVGSGPTGFNVSANTSFGNADFRVYNINFQNTSPQGSGPQHAIGISRANTGFYFCGFYSYQDTVYIGKLGNAYFYKSELAGQTDFLYGFGTAWIEQSKVTLRGCGGGIIAWKGTNTTTPNNYGCYINHSNISGETPALEAANVHRCSLGRPWNNLHRSVYIKNYMSSMILPQGYTWWGNKPSIPANLVLFGEADSYGPGANDTARIAGGVTKILTADEESKYSSPDQVFRTPDGKRADVSWIDRRFWV